MPLIGGRILLLMALLLLSPACAYLRPPPLTCKPCWIPAPCEDPWIPIDESAGGGCLLIVPQGHDCPAKEE